MNKKQVVRANFRDAVFKRDAYKCKMCGAKPTIEDLDAHHITDRSLMVNGGYVKENGISLCKECHIKAEQFHNTGASYPSYSPEDLYKKIGSNYDKAVQASKKI